MLPLLVILACGGLAFTGCGSSPISEWRRTKQTTDVSRWLIHCGNITWLNCQVSGRRDGATAYDNIYQASQGDPARRSCYGRAPGGSVRLDPRMLRAMRDLAKRGYSFRVTALAGASHSRDSRHYVGVAFDVDTINGHRIAYGNPYWRKFLARCRKLGATETLGPGDRGHSTHLHAAWPR